MHQLATVLMIGLLAAGTANAQPLSTPPDLAAAGWKTYKFGDGDPARFIGHEDGRLEVYTYSSTSMLFREFTADDDPGEKVHWRWRVDQATPATDLSRKGGDDRSLAVHIWFPESKGHGPGLFTRIGRGLARSFGAPVPGNAITYVWGGEQAPGTVLPNPYFKDGVIIVLEDNDAPLKTWRDVEINWRADFTNAFGWTPPNPSLIAISADSDDTASQSQGFITDIRLSQD